MTGISNDSTVSRTADVVASDIDGETVMMNVESGEYYSINDIGSRIWGLIETPFEVSRLIERLMEEFEVDRPTCEKETLHFLEQLQEADILTVQPG